MSHEDLEFIEYVRKMLKYYDDGVYTKGEVVGAIGHKFVKTVIPNYQSGETVKLKFKEGHRFLFVGDSCDERDVEEVMES